MDLYAFLNPEPISDEKEVIISERFKNQEGKVTAFKIRSLTQEENEKLVKKSTKRYKSNGAWQEEFDTIEYGRRLVVEGTTYPNFSDRELCERYGVLDPLLVPVKMLNVGEYRKLLNSIMDFSGLEDIDEDAKN